MPICRQLFSKLLWCFLSCLSSIRLVFSHSFAQIIISFSGKQASARLTLLWLLLVLILIFLAAVVFAGKYAEVHQSGIETPNLKTVPVFHIVNAIFPNFHCFITQWFQREQQLQRDIQWWLTLTHFGSEDAQLWYESLDCSCITPKSLLGAIRDREKKRVLLGWKKTVLNWRSSQYIFTSLPLFSSLYAPPSSMILSFISKRKNRKRLMNVGGKLRTWPGTQVELSWTQKQSAPF